MGKFLGKEPVPPGEDRTNDGVEPPAVPQRNVLPRCEAERWDALPGVAPVPGECRRVDRVEAVAPERIVVKKGFELGFLKFLPVLNILLVLPKPIVQRPNI